MAAVKAEAVEAVAVEGVAADCEPPQPETSMLEQRICEMQAELRLDEQFVRDLLMVSGMTDIVVIADDSGSMNQVADTKGLEPRSSTRWHELRETLFHLTTLMLVIEHTGGFWLKFLNEDAWWKVCTKDDLAAIMQQRGGPLGGTPLQKNLSHVVQGYGDPEKDTLILVLTDGEPTDCSFSALATLVASKPTNVYVSFGMCTDNDAVVEMYNQTIDPIPGCDVTDDYISERREAQSVGNELTVQQWLVKQLLVKFDRYDKLDERKLEAPGDPGALYKQRTLQAGRAPSNKETGPFQIHYANATVPPGIGQRPAARARAAAHEPKAGARGCCVLS